MYRVSIEQTKQFCIKVSYQSKFAANRTLYHIRQSPYYLSEDGTIPVRCYRCFLCNKWHLTSKTEDRLDD